MVVEFTITDQPSNILCERLWYLTSKLGTGRPSERTQPNCPVIIPELGKRAWFRAPGSASLLLHPAGVPTQKNPPACRNNGRLANDGVILARALAGNQSRSSSSCRTQLLAYHHVVFPITMIVPSSWRDVPLAYYEVVARTVVGFHNVCVRACFLVVWVEIWRVGVAAAAAVFSINNSSCFIFL